MINKSKMFRKCHTRVSMCLTRDNITYFIRFLKTYLNKIPFQNSLKTLAYILEKCQFEYFAYSLLFFSLLFLLVYNMHTRHACKTMLSEYVEQSIKTSSVDFKH